MECGSVELWLTDGGRLRYIYTGTSRAHKDCVTDIKCFINTAVYSYSCSSTTSILNVNVLLLLNFAVHNDVTAYLTLTIDLTAESAP